RGKNPFINSSSASSLDTSTDLLLPINLLPRPATVIVCFFLELSPASNSSFVARHECHSETDCHGSSSTPCSANLPAAQCASARSMLSPPPKRWFPTAIRRNYNSPL